MQDNFEINGMKIQVIVVGPVQTNCYIASNVRTKKAIIVDPGDEAEKIIAYVKSNELIVEAILLTHGHFDHISAADSVRNEFKVPVYAYEIEADVVANPSLNCSVMCGGPVALQDVIFLKDGEKRDFAGFQAEVISTPGHTHGSVCYYFHKNDLLFSGDTLFRESVGRTDLPTGSSSAIVKGIKERLLVLDKETYVFPGHGNGTTIEFEIANNPYMSDMDF